MHPKEKPLPIDQIMQEKARMPELDGLRGVAILLVLLWHVVVSIDASPGSALAYFLKLFGLAWVGVDLFFVLSGFLIATVLLDRTDKPRFIVAFYVRRAFRILPLYFFCVAALYLLRKTTSPSTGGAWEWLFGNLMPWWSYLTLTQNFAMADVGSFGGNALGITWSLAIEEQFYLLMPIFLHWMKPAQLTRFCVFGVIACNLARFAIVYSGYRHAEIANYVLLLTRCDSLLLGVWVACAVRSPQFAGALNQNKKLLRAVLGALGLLILAMIAASYPVRAFALAHGGYTVIAAFFAICLLMVVQNEWQISRCVLRLPALRWLGLVAFGLYLLHQPVRGLVHLTWGTGPPKISSLYDVWLAVISTFFALALASACWLLFERPLIARGKTLSRRIETRFAGPA
jgi:peptidoglycan/LPS O-acetylase OafA/YrhL